MSSTWLVRNTRWTVVFIAGGYLVYYQSWEIFNCIVGAIMTASTAKLLKILIRQPRPNQNLTTPTSWLGIFTDSSDYGMPSSHTSSLTYFATYLALYGWRWYLVPVWAFATISAASRVYHRYHTVGQIVGGVVVGFFGANLCYYLCH